MSLNVPICCDASKLLHELKVPGVSDVRSRLSALATLLLVDVVLSIEQQRQRQLNLYSATSLYSARKITIIQVRASS